MTNTTQPPRKSSREVEIDHLLAEEFQCDADFSARFAAACGLQFDTFRVTKVEPEPSLGGDGFGDLLVEADMDGQCVALLIEDKITAAAATRQAERYSAYAERMLEDGWSRVTTVLVAPKSYLGERARYDASVNLEDVADWLQSHDEHRRDYRRSVIARALEKKSSTGVRNPDPAMLRLHSEYLNWVHEKCAQEDAPYVFPPLKEAYYDGDSWIDRVRHPDFPKDVWLRHRLWTSADDAAGKVDLIISPASDEVRSKLERSVPDRAKLDTYGTNRAGIQISIRVPEMRQSSGFRDSVAGTAFAAMDRLTDFFLRSEIKSG